MTIAIQYSIAVKAARAGAVLSALDAHASAAKLLVCSGESPSGLAAAVPESVLVALTLSKPAGAVNAEAELVLGAMPESMVTSVGVAKWAQLQTGAGTPIANLSVGAAGSGASIILSNTSLDVGSLLRITEAKLIEQ